MIRTTLVRTSLVAAALLTAGLASATTVGDRPAYPGGSQPDAAWSRADAGAPTRALGASSAATRDAGGTGDFSAYPGAFGGGGHRPVASTADVSPTGAAAAAGTAAGAVGGVGRGAARDALYVY